MKELTCLSAVAVAALAVAEQKIAVYAPTANLEEFRTVARDAKELGANHVWATQIEPSLWIWDRNRHDPYPNWSFGHATIFKYVVREEIDMSYELADLIDTAPGRIFFTAPKKEWTTVMTLEPDLSASLRKRAEIMENHRRDGFACVWRILASCDSRVASPIRHCSRLRVFCRWNLLFGNRQADRA